MQEKFHFPPLFHVTDFTPYTLNIQDSEQCPGGTLPHASPPHALAQAVKSKAKNFNWPFPLFPTPHCLLVLTAPSLARIQSRAVNKTLRSCTVPRETLACKDHNRQVVWLAKILKAACRLWSRPNFNFSLHSETFRTFSNTSVCSSVVAMWR